MSPSSAAKDRHPTFGQKDRRQKAGEVLAVRVMSSSPAIRAVARALPPHYLDQETLIGLFRDFWAAKHHNVDRVEDLHRALRVKGRYLSLPPTEYLLLDTFEKRNRAWANIAADLGERAVLDAISAAAVPPQDIDHFFFVTVTGIGTPSLDVALANRLELKSDLKRSPLFGLGCAAGACGLARAADYLRAYPSHVAVLLSVELCSLTLQREDLSVANIIASGLFGDGAAAVVLTGAGRDARTANMPRILASRSVLYPGTEQIMGWDVVDTGLKVVLSAQLPELLHRHIRRDVDGFLMAQGIQRSDIRHWIAHTGGPKVLNAFEEGLELPPHALDRSWKSLSEVGNLSSASVLFVLGDFLASAAAREGDYGLLLSAGPGLCVELVLLQW
jgi:alkylresorcinol/alkylpyrone synthase